ncbi:MAG: DUF4174 domain-containing protein [Rickettsiales bacterium]|nr:DUF4174 domain-containing protein [Rickettsiales bacterium]
MSCEKHRVAQVFEQYLWQKRVVLVFAPSEESSLLAEQRQMFDTYQEGLKERDVVRWVVVKDETVIVDKRHQPHMPSSRFYRHFNVDNKTFTVIVLGKDGTEKLRQQQKVIPSDQLFALIDSMPMRKKEIEERKRS